MSQTQQKTIVLVDNNPANLEILADILTQKNYRVIKATDGKEGLFATRQYTPDLVIIDKEVPKISSYELAEKIKEDHNLKQIPLLSVIDSHYKFCDLDMFADCLTKPLSKNHLLNTIEDIIQENTSPFSTSSKPKKVVGCVES